MDSALTISLRSTEILESEISAPQEFNGEIEFSFTQGFAIAPDLTAIKAMMTVEAFDRATKTPFGKVGLAAIFSVTGLGTLRSGEQVSIPIPFLKDVLLLVSHMVRGAMIAAGRGTVLERVPMSLLTQNDLADPIAA